jgi:hypothetical protein
LLDGVDVAFNDIAALVILGIKDWGSSALAAAALAVGDLVRRFGNDRDDPSSSQPESCCSTGVGLVAAEAVRAATCAPAPATVDFQMRELMLQDGTVMGLAGAHEYDQRPSSPVDEVVDRAGQTAAGAANPVVRRLDRQIRVIRPSPLCHG